MSIVVIVISSYITFGEFAFWVKAAGVVAGIVILYLFYRLNLSMIKTTIDTSIDIKYLSERHESEINSAKDRNMVLSGILIASIAALAYIEPYSKLTIWLKVSVHTCVIYYFYAGAVLHSLSEELVGKIRALEKLEH